MILKQTASDVNNSYRGYGNEITFNGRFNIGVG